MVRECGGLFDAGQRDDVLFLETLTADGEVLHRTLRLGAVERVYRNLYLAHGVVLDAVFHLVPNRLFALEASLFCNQSDLALLKSVIRSDYGKFAS